MNFRQRYRPPNAGFQMTPMIDVIFILLCFFIANAVYSQWEYEVDITLPTAESGEVPDRLPGEIIINIDAQGRVVVNQQELDRDALQGRLERLAELFPGQPVVIRADKTTAYEDLMRVIDLCRLSDIWNLSFATGEEE